MYYYHVTYKKKLPSIMSRGLIPSEPTENTDVRGVYLFKSQEDAKEALVNWLGERYRENEDLVLLEIRACDVTAISIKDAADYEIIATNVISPDYIEVAAEYPAVKKNPGKSYEQRAIDEYGLTDYWRDAGFILRDGSLLNLRRSTEGNDHRIVAYYLRKDSKLRNELKQGTQYRLMKHWMEVTGAIRFIPECFGIDIVTAPTRAQYRAIRELAGYERGLLIDVRHKQKSSTRQYAAYDTDDAIDWIRDFYEE